MTYDPMTPFPPRSEEGILMKYACPVCVLFSLIVTIDATAQVTDLAAAARNGQIFLTWKEADVPAGSTFNVYLAAAPINDLSTAKLVAHHVEPHSARDWWEDPASFKKEEKPGKPVGFRIQDGAAPLDPSGGLFVHTVALADGAKLFFAVANVDAAGQVNPHCVLGENSLRDGVSAQPGEIQPIWIAKGSAPAAGAGKDLPLWLNLHAKGGVVKPMEYLFFGDATMGWREGLAFKFSAVVHDGEVVVKPTDRVWINRPHDEASDGGTPAIWTFWYGYNSNIFDRKLMGQGVVVNYTERRNLWLLSWVSKTFETDPTRWYCSGSSMGGCGTISFGFRHPELFAALHARVPIVSYTYLGRGSAVRFEPSCWTGKIPDDLKTGEGELLLEHHNGIRYVSQSKDDLPMLFLENGRQDGSIPWQNNPPFYRAMEEAHQPFAAWWDNGTHSTCGKDEPADIKDWNDRFRSILGDVCIPAFSHTSSDRNPGNGDPADGDVIGWINRGMDWHGVEDSSDYIAIILTADYPGVTYPVTTDVTLRRRQKFKPRAGESLSVIIGSAPAITIAVTPAGQITIPGISIPDVNGVRVIIQRKE